MADIRDNEIICLRKTFPSDLLFCTAITYKLIKTLDPNFTNELADVYSVLIIKENYEEPESVFVYDIARDRSKAELLLRMLYAGEVTPCTAEEVISDLI